MSIVAESARRVEDQTDPRINSKIERQTQANVAFFAAHPEQVDWRLGELDREWDIERWLQFNSSALTLLGLSLTVLRGRGWLLLPLAVQGFYMQHTLQGWCPPLPILRHFGIRTQREIEAERQGLLDLKRRG